MPGPSPGFANDDVYAFQYNQPLVYPSPGFLANDTDSAFNPIADPETVVFDLVSGPYSGVLDVEEDWSFTYTPNADTLSDEIVYRWYYQAVPGDFSSEGSVEFHAVNVGSGVDNNCRIVIRGYATKTRATSLFVACLGSGNAATTLFTRGHAPASGWVPLHTDGVGDGSASATLFLKNAQVGSGNKVADLFVAAPSSGSGSRPMNLWVGGEPYFKNYSSPLFTQNSDSGSFNYAPLYVSGEGSADGGWPGSGGIPLYLARNPGAAATLFLLGDGSGEDAEKTLFVRGSAPHSGSAPLAVPGPVGTASRRGAMFTIGY